MKLFSDIDLSTIHIIANTFSLIFILKKVRYLSWNFDPVCDIVALYEGY